MNDMVFWIGLMLILAGLWVSLAENRETMNWCTALGVAVWTANATITFALNSPALTG